MHLASLSFTHSVGEVNRKSLVTVTDGETIGTGAFSSCSVQKEQRVPLIPGADTVWTGVVIII